MEGPITYDELLRQKLKNCGNWLLTLPPLKDKPDLGYMFLNFTEEERERNFKKWYLDNVKPNIEKMGVRQIGYRLIVQNGFLVTDFKTEDMEKFLSYLSCFCVLCRNVNEQAGHR